jgi:hypothetical protein
VTSLHVFSKVDTSASPACRGFGDRRGPDRPLLERAEIRHAHGAELAIDPAPACFRVGFALEGARVLRVCLPSTNAIEHAVARPRGCLAADDPATRHRSPARRLPPYAGSSSPASSSRVHGQFASQPPSERGSTAPRPSSWAAARRRRPPRRCGRSFQFCERRLRPSRRTFRGVKVSSSNGHATFLRLCDDVRRAFKISPAASSSMNSTLLLRYSSAHARSGRRVAETGSGLGASTCSPFLGRRPTLTPISTFTSTSRPSTRAKRSTVRGWPGRSKTLSCQGYGSALAFGQRAPDPARLARRLLRRRLERAGADRLQLRPLLRRDGPPAGRRQGGAK